MQGIKEKVGTDLPGQKPVLRLRQVGLLPTLAKVGLTVMSDPITEIGDNRDEPIS